MAEADGNAARGPAPEPTEAERHASWLELFFDLVVVIAVAQVSQRLRTTETVADAAITAVVFYAIWNVWVSFTVYSNVWGEQVRARSMYLGMFGIAVMAACVPDVTGDRGTTFIVAYLASRIVAGGSFRQGGTVLPAWSLAQQSAGAVLWLVSIWADDPLRYWLWGAAAVIDLGSSVLTYARPERFLRDRQREAKRHDVAITVAEVNASHLSERLGLFVVIVLGEAVAQLVDTAAEVDFERNLIAAAVLGFWVLVCLFLLTVGRGYAAIPNPDGRTPPPAVLLPSHLLTTAGITAIAAGLGSIAEHSDATASDTAVWLMSGGAAAFLCGRLVIGAYQRAPRSWLWGRAVPAVAVALAAPFIWPTPSGQALIAGVGLLAVWQLNYTLPSTRSRPASTA